MAGENNSLADISILQDTMSNVRLEMSQLRAEVADLKPQQPNLGRKPKSSPEKMLKYQKNKRLVKTLERLASGEKITLSTLLVEIDTFTEAYGPRISNCAKETKFLLCEAHDWGIEGLFWVLKFDVKTTFRKLFTVELFT